VPTGALADRFSRRAAVVTGELLQASCYALWMCAQSFSAFAAGFVLWGLGGSLASGALEALVHDGLVAVDAREQYGPLIGRIRALQLLAQAPAAVAAAALFAVGGYSSVGWVSVGVCVASALVASRLPEHRPVGGDRDPGLVPDADDRLDSGPDDRPGYLATLRAGSAEILLRPALLAATLAVAVLSGLDALDEYFPLIAHDWGVPTGVTPLVVLVIPLTGAVGASLGGMARRLPIGLIATALGLAAGALAVAARWGHPAGLASVAVFYGLYRAALVVAETRLQERITGPYRATITSVAGLLTEVACFGLYALWAAGGLVAVSAAVPAIAAALPILLREPQPPGRVVDQEPGWPPSRSPTRSWSQNGAE
jgi:MFS family permease